MVFARWGMRWALAGILFGLGGPAAMAAEQGIVVKSQHGDWQVRCHTPPGAPEEQCFLVQDVRDETREEITLTVVVLKTADKKTQLLRVAAPLGVLLPQGLGLKIDDTDAGHAPFMKCLRTCITDVVMDEALLKQLSTGKQATFVIFRTPEEGIAIPISLNGFGEGIAQLP